MDYITALLLSALVTLVYLLVSKLGPYYLIIYQLPDNFDSEGLRQFIIKYQNNFQNWKLINKNSPLPVVKINKTKFSPKPIGINDWIETFEITRGGETMKSFRIYRGSIPGLSNTNFEYASVAIKNINKTKYMFIFSILAKHDRDLKLLVNDCDKLTNFIKSFAQLSYNDFQQVGEFKSGEFGTNIRRTLIVLAAPFVIFVVGLIVTFVLLIIFG